MSREGRATRAYLAGLGTAGSLVAGAALAFVLASALVSFNGWPPLNDSGSGPLVLYARAHGAHPSVATRRVQAVTVALAVGPSTVAGGLSTVGRPVAATVGPAVGIVPGPLPAGPRSVPPTSRATSQCGSSCAAGSPVAPTAPAGSTTNATGGLIGGVSNTAGRALSGTGAGVEGTVGTLTQTVAGATKPLSSGLVSAAGQKVATLLGH